MMEFLLVKYPNLITLQSSIRSFPYLYSKIRNQSTSCVEFAKYAKRIMSILSEEGLASIQPIPTMIDTPTGVSIPGVDIDLNAIVAISIIRAGDSMLDTFLTVCPEACVGKILIQRNEDTAEPILYYTKVPIVSGKKIFILDPMLATGGSAITAIREVIKRGALEEDIIFLNVVACPEGIHALFTAFPSMKIVTGWIDDGLNEKKYIVPGLGDFGDRFYGTTH